MAAPTDSQELNSYSPVAVEREDQVIFSDESSGDLIVRDNAENISRLQSAVHEYDPALTYSQDDFTIFQGELYSANQAVGVTLEFEPAKWDLVTAPENSLGYVEGFAITINNSPTNTLVDIAPGTAIFVDRFTDPLKPEVITVRFAGVTGISPTFINSATVTIFGINKTGTIIQQATLPTLDQAADIVYFAVTEHLNLLTINQVGAAIKTHIFGGGTIGDVVHDNTITGGGSAINRTLSYFVNSLNTKEFDNALSEIYNIGCNVAVDDKNPNIEIVAPASPVQFLTVFRTTSGIKIIAPLVPFEISTGVFDDGTDLAEPADPEPDGVISPAMNRFTYHQIFFDSIFNRTFMQFGQNASFQSIEEARDSFLGPDREVSLIGPVALLVGAWIVRGDYDDLGDPVKAEYVDAPLLGGSSNSGSTSFAGLTDTNIAITASGEIAIYDAGGILVNKAISGDATLDLNGVLSLAANIARTDQDNDFSVTQSFQDNINVDYQKEIFLNADGTGTGGANATAILTADVVTSITVDTNGSGYVTPPTVTITGGGGTGATATAILTGDTVTSITVDTGGSGYVSPPTITLVGGTDPTSTSISFKSFDFSGTPIDFITVKEEGVDILLVHKGNLFVRNVDARPNLRTIRNGTINVDDDVGSVGFVYETNTGSFENGADFFTRLKVDTDGSEEVEFILRTQEGGGLVEYIGMNKNGDNRITLQKPTVLAEFTTVGRPTGIPRGTIIYDITLGNQITFDGTNWVDGVGTMV